MLVEGGFVAGWVLELSWALEVSVEVRKARCGDNGSPDRHVWHCIFIHELEASLMDVDSGKVQQNFDWSAVEELRKCDIFLE